MPTLTTSGSPTVNGDSTVTIDSTDRVQAPIALTDETQGWFAARCVIPVVEAGLIKTIAYIWDDTSNYVRCYLGETAQGGQWRIWRTATGQTAGNDALIATGTPGNDATIIGAWTSTEVKLSKDGGAFDVEANTNIPTLSATLWDIGSRGASHPLGTKLYWYAAGTGTLSDSDASTIHGFGNTDPDWGDFPIGAELTLLWKCDDFTYEDTGILLESVLPDADITTTGWSTAPLFSKINDDSDATVITATAS
jgi:hypothetical protein